MLTPRPATALAGRGADRALPLSVSTWTATAATSSLIGYALWDHAGKRLWSHDEELKDHADGVAVGNFSDDPKAEPRVYAGAATRGS